jgi:DGQHR domain-containing protein
MPAHPQLLRLPALRIRQGTATFYLAAVDGKLLGRFASVAHTRRGRDAQLHGYQRTEVRRHIDEIRAYLESPFALMPNALTVAFDDRVRFQPATVASPVGYADYGQLLVPLVEDGDQAGLPGWLVDGQQRSAAVAAAALEVLPVGIAAFISGDQEFQRDQFLRINNTKPLPKSLLYELLPRTTTRLSAALERRRQPARLLERLNYDPDSPLQGMIKTHTNPDGIVKDNSLLRTLGDSIGDGALYRSRDRATGIVDLEPALALLKAYWTAVRQVFPDAWGLPPRRSRLLHGAGVVALGFLMDAICDRYPEDRPPTVEQFAVELGRVADVCRWTSGTWEFLHGVTRSWSDLQNTGKDARLVTDLLLRTYRARLAAADEADQPGAA